MNSFPKFWTCCLLGLFTLLPAWSQTAKRALRVAFVSPSTGKELFWEDLSGVMKAAAQDLGYRLDTYRAPVRRSQRAAFIKELLRGPNRPRYLVLTIHGNVGASDLELAEAAKVPVFILNAGLLRKDAQRVGGPREQLKCWIGQMVPNEEQAGYDLAARLIAAGEEAFGEEHLQVLALGGREIEQPALDRNKGLVRAVEERKGATLLELATANYERSQAMEAFPTLLKRFPQANILWAANDPMALGGMAGIQGMGRTLGKDLLVGGMDWDPQALEAIRQGRMVASMGGHFFDGGWVMVLLFDHYHGVDFAAERVDWRSRMYALTRANLPTYTRAFGDRNWSKINFRVFSKFLHPEIKRYAFSVESLLRQQPSAPVR